MVVSWLLEFWELKAGETWEVLPARKQGWAGTFHFKWIASYCIVVNIQSLHPNSLSVDSNLILWVESVNFMAEWNMVKTVIYI